MLGHTAERIGGHLQRKRIIHLGERFVLCVLALSVLFLPLLMGTGLFVSASKIFLEKPLTELFGMGHWNPAKDHITFLPFLAGTLGVAVLAIGLALPLALGVAVYFTEYASARFTAVFKPMIDILAGIPSVIFGLWGVMLIVPLVRDIVAPLCGVSSTGYTLLSAALVLAVMISPLLVQVIAEVLDAVPADLRQAVFALGATRWEVVYKAVLPKALPGIIAAVVLALARALGETLAVMMVIGGVPKVPAHPLSPTATLSTLIANGYSEMSSVPSYERALMAAAFMLLVVVAGFTLLSRVILVKVKRRIS